MRLEKRSSMINYKSLLIGSLLVFILNAGLFPESEYIVIKNPVPNLKEKNFVHLKKVGEIIDEVAKGVFLFLPCSLAMDDQNFLYVYDAMQARILIFDPSFKYVSSLGGEGKGPGEFSSTGRNARVSIYFGLDGRLYANDKEAYKILVFDTQKRKYLKDINFNPRYYPAYFMGELPVDSEGNIILQDFQDNKLVIFTGQDHVLFTIPHKEKKKEILFFERKMIPPASGKVPPKVPFTYTFDELVLKYTRRNTLLVYFPLSATLFTVPSNGKPQKNRIWVDRAITNLHMAWQELKDGYGYSTMFENVFLDDDNPDFIYFGSGGTSTRAHIYKINLKGELAAVMIAPATRKAWPQFLLKKNGTFFAIVNEKIIIYKE